MEVLNNPELRDLPVVVGGISGRGVVTSASYEARRFGVRSAMPMVRARKLCPNGVFLPPNFSAYTTMSQRVREVFDAFSVSVEPLSLDEAFLDIRRARRLWRDPATVAEALKDRVMRSTGLVVSVGVAPNKLLAKLGSRVAKPNGVRLIRQESVKAFLHPLPVDYLWGVGEQTGAVLRRLGVRTVGDLAAIPAATLERVLGSHGAVLSRLAAGEDDRKVLCDQPARSVSAEETFREDLVERTQVQAALLKLSDRVASRLRGQGNSGETVGLKVRLANFETYSRSRTLKHEVDGVSSIYGVSRELLEEFLDDQPPSRRVVRLLGVRVSNLSQWPASHRLVFDREPEWAAAEQVLDRVRNRFGDDAVGFAALLGEW